MPRKKYDTPHRSRVVKTRMTEEEYADFAARLAPYGISQSEFIRRAIHGASIRPVVTVSPVNDELLAALGKLTSEYGRIGNNLNQIARAINDWHNPYPQLAAEVRAVASDLAALKFEVLEKVVKPLATFKHISSKNANYGDAEKYLTFAHDEFTMKPTLDANGRLVPREDYRISTLNCGEEDFAVACMRSNLRYDKNQKREDVKSHHYIISFDPRDARTTG